MKIVIRENTVVTGTRCTYICINNGVKTQKPCIVTCIGSLTMKYKIFTFFTILIFANGINIKRDEESSKGGDLLGSNTKSVPLISKSSIRNLVNSVNIPDEEPTVVKRPKHYNPEAVYNHIVNVKGRRF